jgi:hypothetical protein
VSEAVALGKTLPKTFVFLLLSSLSPLLGISFLFRRVQARVHVRHAFVQSVARHECRFRWRGWCVVLCFFSRCFDRFPF